MRQARIGIIVGAAALLVLMFASGAFALDPPHDAGLNCRNCHDKLADKSLITGGIIDNTPVNQACQLCHKGVIATAKLTHSSVTTSSAGRYGPWAAECPDCHDPHYQAQMWTYPGAYDGSPASGSYLETGTITGFGAANKITVSFTNAGGWPDDEWIGYTLFADVSDYLFYRVVDSDSTSLSVEMDFDTDWINIGDTFALGYGKLIRTEIRTGRQVVNSGGSVYNTNVWRPVKFFNTSGIYSPAWSMQAQNAVCVVCHLKTEAFNIGYAQVGQGFDNVTSDYANTWHKDNTSSGATNCWTTSGCHDEPALGFDANCTGCHGQPPVDFSTLISQTSANASPWYTGLDWGKHPEHLAKGKGDCNFCHTGGASEDPEHKFADQITMGFSNVVGAGATFVNGVTFANTSWTVESGDGGTSIIDDLSGVRTCSGIYCHSDGSSLLSAAPKLVDWSSAGGSLGCGDCHAHPDSMIADAHTIHAAGDYKFQCYECHADTVDQAPDASVTVPSIKNAAHVNFEKTIAWGNIASGSPAYDLGTSNCDNVYCHAPVSAAQETPNWDSSLNDDCKSCHDSSGLTSTNLSGAHAAHTNTGAGGNQYQCLECHDTVLLTNTTIDFSSPLHVNKTKDVDAAKGYAASSCSATVCHGPVGSPIWTMDLTAYDDCTKCHGVKTVGTATEAQMAPGDAGQDLDGHKSAADTNVGAHQAHLGSLSNYSADITCDSCHVKPSTPTDAGHFDSSRPAELTFSAFANNFGNLVSAYNVGTGECSNTYCHGNNMPNSSAKGLGNTPVWNSTSYLSGTPGIDGDCDQCHLSPPSGYGPSSHSGSETLSDCDSCHGHFNDGGTLANALLHIDGIVQAFGCTGCHGQPPVDASTMVKSDTNLGNTGRLYNGAFSGTEWGQHNYHVNGKSYDCDTCHTGGGSGGSHNTSPTGYVTFGFVINGIAGGTYNAPGLQNSSYDINTDGTTTYNMTGSTRTCNSIYCHSDGAGGAPNEPADWDTGDGTLSAPGDCNMCHGSATELVITQRHDVHAGSTQYNFNCSTCHADTVDDSKNILDNHVDFIKNVVFNSVNPSGSFSQGPDTCMSMYCHSDAKGSGPNNTPEWNNASSLPADCTGCHDNDKDAASMMATGSHTSHLNNSSYVGRDLECYDCHAATVDASDNRAIGIGKLAKHVDGAIDNLVGMDGIACNNISCHSGGNYDGARVYNNPTWGAADLKCWSCHGNGTDQAAPIHYADGDEAGPNSNSHLSHVVSDSIACQECHSLTTVSGTTIDGTVPDAHVNKIVNVSLRQGGTYTIDDTDTCSSTYCHNTGEPVWGSASLACNACHDASSALPGSHAKHYGTTRVATDRVAGRVSNTTAYEFKCGVCHEGTSHAGGEVIAGFSTAEVIFNATYAGASAANALGGSNTADGAFWFTDTTCSSTQCHDDGLDNGPNIVPVWGNSPMSCGDCHDATPDTNAHSVHIANGTVITNARCDTCHEKTVSNISNSVLEDLDYHVNNIKDVIFNSVNPSGSYDGSTCTSMYCHSKGGSGAPNTSPVWTSSLPNDCTGCHDNDKDAASPMITGSHASHLDNSLYVGRDLECYDCHAATVDASDNRAIGIGKLAKHVDGAIDNLVGMDGIACNNISCHSGGNYDGARVYNNPTWGAADLKCWSCHGNGLDDAAPDYGDGDKAGVDSNSHDKHVGTDSIACQECHSLTTVSGTWIDGTAPEAHVNKIVNVSLLQGGTYTDGTDTCSSTYCHGGGEPVWGDTLGLNCDSCHRASELLSGKHSFHYNSAAVATDRNPDNLSTAGNYRFNCGVCHNVEGHAETAHADGSNNGAFLANGYTVDIVFNLSAWSASGGAYSNNVGATAVGNYTYWSQGTCASVYCHSDGQLSPTYNSVTWDGAAQGCGSCHGEADLKNDVKMSGVHNSHVGTDVYGFACGECHVETVADDTSSPITNKILHVNGAANVVFGSAGAIDQSAGSYGGGTCSTTYCHSDGQDAYTSKISPDWTAAGSATCTTCHDNNGVASGLSDAHDKHARSNTQSYTCDNCHSETVANNTTTTLAAGAYNVHVDGIQNIVFSNSGFSTDHYDFIANSASYNDTPKTCSSVYCHSTVQADGGVGAPFYNTPDWDDATTVECGNCHLADGSQGDATTMASGSHTKHVSAGGESLDCIECHTGGGPANIGNHVDGKITLIINSLHGGTYSQSDGGGESNPRNNYGTCSSVYCHSSGSGNAGGSPPIYNSPTWDNPASAACGECHRGRKSDAKTMDTQAHNEHLAYGGLDIRCNDCHDGLGSGQAKHVDKNVDFSFLAANAGGSAAYSNSGLAAGDGLYGKCSSVYCHGNFSGGSNAGVGATPNWDDATAACGTCHDATPSTNAHTKHLELTSVSFACTDCHGHEGSSTHVGMLVNGILNTASWYFSASSTYDSQTVNWDSGKADSGSVSTCGTVECHSSVQGAGGSGLPVYNTPDWGTPPSVVCGSCHKADGAQGDNSLMDSGTHTKHVSGESFGCDECHAYGGKYLIANHVNNGIDVGNSTNIGSYDQDGNAPGDNYGTCNTIACHGGNNATWGGLALTCRDCHFSETDDVDDFSYDGGAGTIALIKNAGEWDEEGHGRPATGNYLVTLRSGANFDTVAGTEDGCLYCHDPGISHGSATNPFRLRNNNALGNGQNDTCLVCHDTDATGGLVKPDASLTGITNTGVVKVDKWHNLTAHSQSGKTGGNLCWDCHDPHGDDDNIQMIQAQAIKDHDGYGMPGAAGNIVGAPIVFTDNTTGTGAGGFARTSPSYDEGLCNACHDVSASSPKMQNYTNTSSNSHNSGSVCTTCHEHSVDTTNDGKAWEGAGTCNGCHGYPPDASDGQAYMDGIGESKGAHIKHVDHLMFLWNGGSSASLDPDNDSFDHGVSKFENVCGACHATATHDTGDSVPANRTIVVNSVYTFGPSGVATYLGIPGTVGATTAKTCSNVSCHFRKSPEWQKP